MPAANAATAEVAGPPPQPGGARYGLLFLAIAVFLLALVAYEAQVSRQTAKAGATTEARNLSLVLEAKLGADLAAAVRTVTELAAEIDPDAMRPETAGRYRPRIVRLLKSHMAYVKAATALRYFDADGNRLYSSIEEEFDFNIIDRPFFRRIKADPTGGIVFSEIAIGKFSGRASMNVAMPIRDKSGRFLGIAVAPIDLNALHQHFRAIQIGREGVVTLRRLDDGAQVVRYPGPVEIGGMPEPESRLRTAILAGRPAGDLDMVSLVDGVRRIFGYRTIGDYPFFVAVGIAENDYLAEWRRYTVSLLGGALLFLAILAAVFFRLAGAESRRRGDEGRLRESELRFRNLIEGNEVPILQIESGSGNILDANAAALGFYGWSREEMCAMSIHEINRYDSQRVEAEREAALKEGRESRIFSHRLAGGGARVVEVHSTPVFIAKRPMLVAIVLDVTEREADKVRKEDLLREQKAILDSGVVGFVKLRNRKYIWVNDTFAHMVGYTRSELTGMPTRVTYASEKSYEAFARVAYPRVLNGGIYRSEIQYRHKNGTLRWYEVSGGMLYPGSDESIWAIADIDDKKRAQRALLQSEERFRHLTGISSDWYWEQDENLRFTFISSGFAQKRRSVKEYIGKTRWDLSHVDMDPAVMREHDAQLAAREPFKHLVVKRRSLDNSIFYTEISGAPVFDERGRFRGYRGIGRDITDRVRADEAIRALSGTSAEPVDAPQAGSGSSVWGEPL